MPKITQAILQEINRYKEYAELDENVDWGDFFAELAIGSNILINCHDFIMVNDKPDVDRIKMIADVFFNGTANPVEERRFMVKVPDTWYEFADESGHQKPHYLIKFDNMIQPDYMLDEETQEKELTISDKTFTDAEVKYYHLESFFKFPYLHESEENHD